MLLEESLVDPGQCSVAEDATISLHADRVRRMGFRYAYLSLWCQSIMLLCCPRGKNEERNKVAAAQCLNKERPATPPSLMLGRR